MIKMTKIDNLFIPLPTSVKNLLRPTKQREHSPNSFQKQSRQFLMNRNIADVTETVLFCNVFSSFAYSQQKKNITGFKQ